MNADHYFGPRKKKGRRLTRGSRGTTIEGGGDRAGVELMKKRPVGLSLGLLASKGERERVGERRGSAGCPLGPPSRAWRWAAATPSWAVVGKGGEQEVEKERGGRGAGPQGGPGCSAGQATCKAARRGGRNAGLGCFWRRARKVRREKEIKRSLFYFSKA